MSSIIIVRLLLGRSKKEDGPIGDLRSIFDFEESPIDFMPVDILDLRSNQLKKKNDAVARSEKNGDREGTKTTIFKKTKPTAPRMPCFYWCPRHESNMRHQD